jgi:hypothetical protein
VDLAPLVSQLLTICSRDTCPRMKADEWLYLCVAHGSGGTEECCAIDYILHTCVIFLLSIFQIEAYRTESWLQSRTPCSRSNVQKK